MVTADTRVMRRPCFSKDVLLLSGAASLLACVCVLGGGIRLHLHGISSVAVAIYFFLLELCDAASCSVLCAIRIAQQPSVRGRQLHVGFACFWEVARAYVCLVGEGVQVWRGGRMYLGLIQLCLVLRIKLFPFLTSFLYFFFPLSLFFFFPDAKI